MLVCKSMRSLNRNIELGNDIDPIESLKSIDDVYKDKSDFYLECVFSILKFKPSRQRLFKFIQENPESFDCIRFLKFNEFLDNNKNIKGLPYLPKYYELLKGLSKEDAIKSVENFKSAKATSKEGFIARHGVEKGEEMFNKFQKTSAISTDRMKEFNYDFRKRTPLCIEYWQSKGYSVSESEEMVRSFQRDNAGVNRNI